MATHPRKRQKEPIKESDLASFKSFDRLMPLLKQLHEIGTHRDRAGNRQLFYDQYVMALLLYFFNPVITSLRGLQQACELEKVQKLLGLKHLSLGSLSEATQVFDPEPLRHIVHELAQCAIEQGQQQNRIDTQTARDLQGLMAVDGTLLRALPRMLWALWVDEEHRAAKMHLHFDILNQVPCDATVTPGNSSEPEQLKLMVQAAHLYVMDRGYGSYELFRAILDAKSSFIARVQDNVAYIVDHERSLSAADHEAGVESDLVLSKLGTSHHKDVVRQPLRLVTAQIENRHGKTISLRLVTDRMDLPAELVVLAYRYRWSIELFFRWFKCILQFKHLLSEKENGVAIQCYAALIASLIVVLMTGLKPNRRTWEMIQFYLTGWASLEELERHIAKRRQAAPS